MVHSEYLERVTLLEQEEEKLICPPQYLPRYTLTNFGELVTLREPYFSRAFATVRSFMFDTDSSLPSVLIGHPGSGRTHLLKYLADSVGYTFTEVDCLAHFNLSKMQTLLSTAIPNLSQLPQVIELTNFHRYGLLMEGNQL